jgi:hypothetical protein
MIDTRNKEFGVTRNAAIDYFRDDWRRVMKAQIIDVVNLEMENSV